MLERLVVSWRGVFRLLGLDMKGKRPLKCCPMSYDEHDHRDHILRDDALEHVLENEWEAVAEAVHANSAREWLEAESQALDILNVVCGYDRELLRGSVRRLADPGSSEADLAPSKLFALASEVSKLLESARSPYAGRHPIDDDDLTWVVELVEITRAFREFLFVLSGPDVGWGAKVLLDEPLGTLNSVLAHGMIPQVGIVADRKTMRFERKIDPKTGLPVSVANWIAKYLGTYSDAITFAACIECGRIFSRERRDNVYCSKTCQNRVVYKRKRIFEAGVLQPAEAEASVDSFYAGLCLQHARYGLGVVEDVTFPHRRIRLRFESPQEPKLIPVPVPVGRTAQEVFEEVRVGLSTQPSGWDEIVTPTMLKATVRFLSTIRTFSHSDLFSSGRDSVKFYTVTDPRRLADLL